ncbi:PREDICTED: mas-related G-protein coupled receptor member A-like [Chrysochloris asiatica]|uniref:Mas-related G-protein coupled receptor member A-like n=1 Tax=Chrysochloris asiatica TaxID=185453 RepID=A0A9B0TGU7_CHRAS|nr:PREDICTED: mas-related G-protein coupled receptor member A-like [Chrysochloris asiatica]
MASSSTPSLWPVAYNSGLEGMNMEPTNSPGNYTQSKTLARLTFPITVVISLFGLFWNGTVLWLLGFRIKRNAFSVYVLNLAGADFTFLCCQLFFVLTDILTGSYDTSLTTLHFKVKWHFYSTFPMAKLVAPIAFSSYTMDMSLLAAISTERCLSVLCPVWYRFHRPKHLSTIVCVLLWTKSLLVCTLTGDSCGFLSRGYNWYQTLLQPMNLPYYLIDILSCMNSSVNPVIYFFVGSFRQWRKWESLRVVLQRALRDEGTCWLSIPLGAPEDMRGFRAEELWLFPELQDIERGCRREHLRQERVSAEPWQEQKGLRDTFVSIPVCPTCTQQVPVPGGDTRGQD